MNESVGAGNVATADDVAAVAACLADAFHDDPVWGHWTFPDEASRPQLLRRLMEFWATCAVRHPWLRVSGGCEAVAVWFPPGEPEMTPAEEAGLQPLLAELLGPRVAEVRALLEQFDAHHPHDEPHYYLSLWATHRDFAGRGVGTALIQDNLAEIDAEHAAAYLEPTNPANLSRYRALGFEKVGQFAPPNGPTVTTMWRPARLRTVLSPCAAADRAPIVNGR